MKNAINWGKFLYGGDYNPEQWLSDPEILKKDIELFKKAHINVVSLGIFAWSTLEPEEGNFQFQWMEDIITNLHKNGISVILATPSAARPKWLADRYPEVLRVNGKREKQLFGRRHNHCFTSPVYREKTRIINTKLARHFGNHPAVIAWHVSNELGGECHCPLCQNAFRNWLRKKYGSIDQLNKAWATTFWSHTYNSFEQVESPSPIGETALHGLNLDWKRFVTDQTLDFLNHEIQAIRDGGSDKPTTINMMRDFTELNYDKLKNAVDFISWDSYPLWDRGENALTAQDCGLQHDFMRSLQHKPYLLMESCPSATNWQPISKLKKPGMLLSASLQAIAHGSDSVMYFQMRQSQGASEKFHGAVIDHYGEADTRVFRDVTQTGAALLQLQEVAGANTNAKVAIIHDMESRWAMENAQGPRNEGLHYMEAVRKLYSAFRKCSLDVDLISADEKLEGYQIVAAPMLYMFREGFSEKIRQYVENGGQFILTYWSGIVNETDLCYLGGCPHGLMEVLGLRSTEIDGLYDWEQNSGVPVPRNSMGISQTYLCKNLCDLVRLSTAEAILTYGEDFYRGMPALTKNCCGSGTAYYVCADFEQSFYHDFCGKLIENSGIDPIFSTLPEGIEVNTRENEHTQYLVVQNFSNAPVSIQLPIPEYEILFGSYDGTIDSLHTVVLKKQKV